MTKRLVDMDDDLLNAAQAVAGERTIKGTVKKALELLVSEQHRTERDLYERWHELGDALADLQDDDVMGRAWS